MYFWRDTFKKLSNRITYKLRNDKTEYGIFAHSRYAPGLLPHDQKTYYRTAQYHTRLCLVSICMKFMNNMG